MPAASSKNWREIRELGFRFQFRGRFPSYELLGYQLLELLELLEDPKDLPSKTVYALSANTRF